MSSGSSWWVAVCHGCPEDGEDAGDDSTAGPARGHVLPVLGEEVDGHEHGEKHARVDDDHPHEQLLRLDDYIGECLGAGSREGGRDDESEQHVILGCGLKLAQKLRFVNAEVEKVG